jgi:hypothetical protein
MILIKNNKFNHSLSLSQKRLNLTNFLNLRFLSSNDKGSPESKASVNNPVSQEPNNNQANLAELHSIPQHRFSLREILAILSCLPAYYLLQINQQSLILTKTSTGEIMDLN